MKILLVACAFLIVASAGADCLASKPYVGLYADPGHSVLSVNYTGTYTHFEMWLWWLPSENGMQAVEFGMTYPSNVIQSTVTINPLGYGIGCNWSYDYKCLAFGEGSCQMDWVWTHHQLCFLTDALPSVIEIGPPPGLSAIGAANCLPGYPVEPVTVLNKLGLNQDGVIAVEPESWGAIKNLYR
ncbi:MAG: hypothetical protein NTW97_04390 [Candidatus Krumholzibacteria bacterium]|nr:hypothetical protein [Candidatus Krumholzibacteria bacterium]